MTIMPTALLRSRWSNRSKPSQTAHVKKRSNFLSPLSSLLSSPFSLFSLVDGEKHAGVKKVVTSEGAEREEGQKRKRERERERERVRPQSRDVDFPSRERERGKEEKEFSSRRKRFPLQGDARREKCKREKGEERGREGEERPQSRDVDFPSRERSRAREQEKILEKKRRERTRETKREVEREKKRKREGDNFRKIERR